MYRQKYTRMHLSILGVLALLAMVVQPVSAAPVLSFAEPASSAAVSHLNMISANLHSDNVSALLSAPEIEVWGNGVLIADGDTTPSAADDTDFGSVAAASGTVVHTFTISNTGTLTLTVSSITMGGINPSDFSVSGISLPAIIAAGGNTTFLVTFNPSVVGLRMATVIIANDDGDENPYDFATLGIGLNTAPLAVDDSGIGFVTDEATAVTLGYVLSNDSDPDSDPLTLNSYNDSATTGILTFTSAVQGGV